MSECQDRPATPRFSATYTYTVVAAWDVFPGKQRHNPYKSGGLSITPFAGMQLALANLTSTYSLLLWLNLTWWTGLTKNQLDLPIDKA